ncbi:MAG: phosphatase PAP2 family protein [Actinomyces sp.]|jgi:hypothetical protein|nr:phosphatase PAP2 family protein [Actinomyces sp.]MCI1788806.1 phosphatase PAP2 family protein [Actinomyces sp.]
MSPRAHKRRLLIAGAASASVLATLGALPALAAPTVPAPDPVALMSEYDDYWTPSPYDKADPSTGFRGDVVDPVMLGANDDILVAINHAGAADETQSHRALIDADYDWKQTLPDALGPVLGAYFSEGVADGSLPLTTGVIDSVGAQAGTGEAKPHYNFPRPFLDDRSLGGENDLEGLQANLGIAEIPDWTDPATGKTHTASYQSMIDGVSQAFPSGHTTYAYSVGFALATLMPQLAPEIITRSSEAGNNRIVLGVHYPLDVMGGRILGEAGVSHLLSDDDYVASAIEPAQQELAEYLTERCAEDGHGDTFEACLDSLGANDAGGYANAFTDAVSTAPVTDRASALAAYRARMTYGFGQVGTPGQAARVPAGAESLLVTAFPTLTGEQRAAVLAATEIDSGFPLDSSSDGWQRLDLAAATSSKVTLDAAGAVVSVEPGQPAASVVTEQPEPTPSQGSTAPTSPAPTSPASQTPAETATARAPGKLADTGADLQAAAPIALMLVLVGGAAARAARRRSAS